MTKLTSPTMRYTRLSVGLVCLAAVSATACKTDLTALNQNPNSPTSAPATTLFTSATVSTLGTWGGAGVQNSMTELWAQQMAQIQYIDEDRGHIRNTTVDNLFAGQYAGPLEDYRKIIVMADSAKQPNTSGPAKIMQSWLFQKMTDLWGDIPYSEALAGDAGGSLTPKYDAQKDIYYGLLATLTSASSSLAGGITGADQGLGSADPIYKGDVAKWQKFANSERARLALRMSKADPAKAATELTAAFAAGTIASNSDNAAIAWPGDGIYDNPLSANFSTRDDHRVAKTLVDTLKALNDPRLAIYAQPTKADPTVYAGMQNGLDNTYTNIYFNTTSRVGTLWYPGATSYGTYGTSAGKKTPTYLMTYAEVSFIKAEAAEKGLGGLTPAQAAGFYIAGVTASITQWGGSASAAATYLAQPGVAYVPGATGLKQIGLQKWIALFTQGEEAWSEWRRTGNPASIVPGPKMYADVPGVPRRLVYSGAELSVNKTSLNAAIAAQGPDTYLTRMWWDK
ncbi:MAG: SusD/RagB family nutrient-binding outer membrane lipoprotein [bacterium]